MQVKLFIENKIDACCNRDVQPEGKIVTFRMTEEFIAEIDAIASETERSRNRAVILLLKRGIEAYRKDGILLDTRPKLAKDDAFNQAALPVPAYNTSDEKVVKTRKKA